MRSKLPKVLHTLAGKTLLQHVYETANALNHNNIAIVYGHGGEALISECSTMTAQWYEQAEQLGTGHAVEQALEHVGLSDHVLILYGDVPLLSVETIEQLLQCLPSDGLSLLTVKLENPHGYGRIVRDQNGVVLRIVEEKDATDAERQLQETNTGVMVLHGHDLIRWIGQLDNANAQQEFYLTDLIEMAVVEGKTIHTVHPKSPVEVTGVNSRQQLAQLEREYQRLVATNLMAEGVGFMDPARFDLRGSINSIGHDVLFDVNVVLEGDITIGNNVRIGPNCHLKNVQIGDDSFIESNSVLEDAVVGPNNVIGPFARLRPGTELGKDVKIGNFVEIKKTVIGVGSKVNHLSYVGDAEIGAGVNVGAGTITCNYDGVNKYKTIIRDGAFIGSDTQLVAPVVVGKNATIGAGSTVTRDAPDDSLTLSRSKQQSIAGWKRPEKESK